MGTPTTSPTLTTEDTTDMARGPLMPSRKPRPIPTICMAMATQLTAMATMERGRLMPSQKPSPRPSRTCTTATRLIPATATAMAMATERGLLTLSPTMATMATDIQLTAMSTGSNLPEPNFADVPTSYWSIILTYVD